MLTGIGYYLLQFTTVHSKRLLAQHSLACTQREQRVLTVERMRRSYINGIHLRIVNQLFVGRICHRNTVIRRELIGALLRARADCISHAVAGMGQIRSELMGDPACAENAPFYLVSVIFCHSQILLLMKLKSL